MCKGPSIKKVCKNLVIFNPLPTCPLLSASGWPLPHADMLNCIHQRLTNLPLTDVWAPCRRPTSHRQQMSSDLSGPFSTARAITVWAIIIAVQLHASTASLSAMLSCRHLHAVKPPFVRICLHLSHPPPLAADVLYRRSLIFWMVFDALPFRYCL